jgi:hypothetical protein
MIPSCSWAWSGGAAGAKWAGWGGLQAAQAEAGDGTAAAARPHPQRVQRREGELEGPRALVAAAGVAAGAVAVHGGAVVVVSGARGAAEGRGRRGEGHTGGQGRTGAEARWCPKQQKLVCLSGIGRELWSGGAVMKGAIGRPLTPRRRAAALPARPQRPAPPRVAQPASARVRRRGMHDCMFLQTSDTLTTAYVHHRHLTPDTCVRPCTPTRHARLHVTLHTSDTLTTAYVCHRHLTCVRPCTPTTRRHP